MRRRVSLQWLGTVFAVPAMVGFLAVGCGDSTPAVQKDAAAQKDGGQDVATQKDGPQDVAQTDTTTVQNDAAADVTNMAGQIILSQINAQPSGSAYDGMKVVGLSAGWTNNPDPSDKPILDKRPAGSPIGCYATHYKFSEGKFPISDTASAGTVAINGFTGGAPIIGIADAGTPILGTAIPKPITCTRNPILFPLDGGATGRYTYDCTSPPDSVPVTGFFGANDKIYVNISGDPLVPGFMDDAGISPAIGAVVTAPGMLWTLQPPTQDAGVTFPVRCGDTDGGACSLEGGAPSLIGILIKSTSTPQNEVGVIQCSWLASSSVTTYTIDKDLWDVAFPAGGAWSSIRTSVVHLRLVPRNNGHTLIGVGSGQFGVSLVD